MLTRVGVPVEFEAEPSAPDPQPTTLICFSHLRWNFVFQRPQHLMSRFAREMNVIYWEEPIDIGARETAYLQVRRGRGSAERPDRRSASARRNAGGCARGGAEAPARCSSRIASGGRSIAWYYTPMMLPFSRDIDADLTVFDAMDELSKFKFAPVKLLELEQELIDRRGHRLHRRIEPLRGQEGPPPQRPLLPLVGRPRAFPARRARASSTRPTRKTCRGRGSAFTA